METFNMESIDKGIEIIVWLIVIYVIVRLIPYIRKNK